MQDKTLSAKSDRLIGIKQTSAKTDLSRSTIYRLERRGLFPKRRQISPGRIGWFESDVEAFLESRDFGCVAGGQRG